MRPDLTVIVVTWNVREPVLACLEALTRRAQNTTLEVIVVDNASSDGTVEAVAETFPTVRIIENTENVGFPRANNQALWLARGRHVLFLNPDTIVGEGTLAACLRELDHDPEIAMVGCRLVYPDGRLQKECARRHYRLRHLLWEAFYLQIRFPDHPIFADQMMGSWDHEGRRDVEALTGAFMMVRRPLALRVGGLPEDIFMYHEDLAFCLRVGRTGYRIRYLGDLVTTHVHGSSASASPLTLSLLEGPVRVALIRTAWGSVAGWAARGLFVLRSLSRLTIAWVGALVPASATARGRYPRVFEPRRHWLNLVWAVAPWAVKSRIPTAPPDKRLKCLLVGPTPPPIHGGSVYTQMLLESPELRASCRLLHLDTADRRSLENLGRLDLTNVGLALAHLAHFVALLRRERPDWVYIPISQNALGYMRDALLILLAKTWGAKVVTHLHGGYFRHFYEEAGRPVRHLIRLTTHRIDSAWVLGEGLRSIYEGLLPPERVRVVPNGVPDVLEGDRGLPREPQKSREFRGPRATPRADPRESAADVGDRVVTILYLGSLLRSKGVFEILEAASLLDERGIRARFVLAGEWVHTEDRLAAHTFLRERRLDGGVSFPGVVQGALKAELLEDADIFAFPTYYPLEGQPLVILEAMAAGLPVVSTPRAAIPDCVVDGKTGILVEERDREALAEALTVLILDPERRRLLGFRGRERFLEHFTWTRCVERFVDTLFDAKAAS